MRIELKIAPSLALKSSDLFFDILEISFRTCGSNPCRICHMYCNASSSLYKCRCSLLPIQDVQEVANISEGDARCIPSQYVYYCVDLLCELCCVRARDHCCVVVTLLDRDLVFSWYIGCTSYALP